MTRDPRTYNTPRTQAERALSLLAQHGMMRTSELATEGVAATTVARLLADGVVLRLSRGLYQLADADLDIHHDLAEATKRRPKGVICLTSALAYHDLTDQMPRKVWMSIGRPPSAAQSRRASSSRASFFETQIWRRSLGDQLVREGLARRWTGRREPCC